MTHATPSEAHAEMVERNLDAKTAELLDALSPANREATKWFIRVRRNTRIEASTATQYARAAFEADQFLKGKAFNEATHVDWLDFHDWLKGRKELGEGSRYTRLQYLKAVLKDRLETTSLPKRIKEALYMAAPDDPEVGQVIDDSWFFRFLKDAETWFSTRKGWKRPDLVVMLQALFWLLWDAGLRVGEALSLRLSDLDFSIGTDVAMIRMRPVRGLKTGPRNVAIGACLPALKTWLAVHPYAGDPAAPLFLGFRRGSRRPLSQGVLWRYLDEASDRIGWTVQHILGSISAHDFRHTAATRDGMAWRGDGLLCIIKLNRKYGWSDKSRMAFYYMHAGDAVLIEQARQDQGVNALGYREGMPEIEEFRLWQRLNAKFLLRNANESLKAKMPSEWEQA